MLSGYKTYLTAIVAVVTAVAAYLIGEASLADTLQLVLAAVLSSTVRNGINPAGGILSGYKTYVTSGVAVVGALAAYLSGSVDIVEAAKLIFTALLASGIRGGISSSKAGA